MFKKLSLVSVVFGLIVSIDCKRVIRFGHVNSNSTTSPASLDDDDGASRATGGWKVDPPPWLGSVWDVSKNDPRGKDSKFAGSAIHLGDGHVLSHQDTVKVYTRDHKDPDGIPKPDQPAQHIVPSPSTINIRKSYTKEHHPRKKDDTQLVDTTLGGTPFHLHKLEPRLDMATDHHSLSKSVLPNLPRPAIEHNVNEFGTDCHAYGWSKSPSIRRSPYGSSRDGSNNERHMVRFPVSKGDCQGPSCQIQTKDAAICDGLTDHGSPVLCGPQRKLTYLLEGGNGGGGDCRKSFTGYHVPHMVNHMKAKGHWMDSFG